MYCTLVVASKCNGVDIILLTKKWDGLNRQTSVYTLQLVMGEQNGIHKIKLCTLPQANK